MYNFIYFLKNAILDNIYYYIIINGTCRIKIPHMKNISIFFQKDKTNDFSVYCYALSNIKKTYEYYYFLNSSIIYPFPNKDEISNYFVNNTKLICIDLILLNKNTIGKYNLDKIYGKEKFLYFNFSFFCINLEYFTFLNKINFFNEKEIVDKGNDYIIAYKNIALIEYLLKNNWDYYNIYMQKR